MSCSISLSRKSGRIWILVSSNSVYCSGSGRNFSSRKAAASFLSCFWSEISWILRTSRSKKQLEKDAAAFREEKFRPEPEQYTELLDTRIQIRPDFRDKLIEQLKGTFGKYYDYHRRDIAANEVDYLNVEDPDVFSYRAWELEYQRKQEMRRNQPARTKKRSYDMEL